MTDLSRMSGRDLDAFLSALPVANLMAVLRAHRTAHGAFWTPDDGEIAESGEGRPEASCEARP